MILWKDYFHYLGQAIQRLDALINYPDLDKNDYVQDAAIHRFELVIELYFKVLRGILIYEKLETTTPRNILKKLFEFKLIDDEQIWLNMLDDKNTICHVYQQSKVVEVFNHIKTYLPILEKTYQKIKVMYDL
jgi:nucleotidyltransferase substrate binding protein (TIGR01987 family)